jgi:hypothetical protein
MAYVMIAVFQIEELPEVIREFVTSGKVKSVKPAYEKAGMFDPPSLDALGKKKHPTGHDRKLILEFIKKRGTIGYNDLMGADLQITDKSLAYNLKYLADRGDIVRVGEKPYRYKISEEKDE